MKSFLLLPVLFLTSCSSQQKIVERNAPRTMTAYVFSVSLPTLKKYIAASVEEELKKDGGKRVEERVSLKNYSYRYKGRMYAPMGELASYALTAKEFGKKEFEAPSPLEAIEDSAGGFLLLFKNTLYTGTFVDSNHSRLQIAKVESFRKVSENVRMGTEALQFESETLDIDKTLTESRRDFAKEWQILERIDSAAANKLLEPNS